MFKIGLTGGIGSGKSTVAKVFEKLKVPVYFADIEAKKFLLDSQIISLLVYTFSDVILMPDGSINRQALGEIVFNDEQSLQQLNAIIHPKLRQHFAQWVAQKAKENHAYVVKEAAILYEAGFDAEVDLVIAVTAPKDQRIQRVMSRDGVTESQVEARMKHQWPQEQISEKADFVIANADDQMILSQIVKLHHQFSL